MIIHPMKKKIPSEISIWNWILKSLWKTSGTAPMKTLREVSNKIASPAIDMLGLPLES